MSQQVFRRDGVVWLRDALDGRALDLAYKAFDWSLSNPGPSAREVLGGREGAFYQDHSNPHAWAQYQELICGTGLGARIADLLGSQSLWLLYEQIWLKAGSATRRTPWHQDLPYLPLGGSQLATVWMPLDVVEAEASLEFVIGSHVGPLYNPTAFSSIDPSAAMFAPGVWPALPDLDATRSEWTIRSEAMQPGDIAVFHPAMLHGGAATTAHRRRRTVSLRFFGDDAVCDPRPETGLSAVDRMDAGEDSDPIAAMARRPKGSAFRHRGFRQVR